MSAVLEEVKGITESLTMSSKEGVEDNVTENNVIEDKDPTVQWNIAHPTLQYLLLLVGLG